MLRWRATIAPVSLLLAGLPQLGCGRNSTAPSGGGDCPTAPQIAGCTATVAPSADDYTAIETALGEADAGGTVCLCPGTFNVSRELDVATENLTVRGAGAAITDTVLDFSKQQMGDKSLAATGGGFTIANLWLKNSPGDGIDVTGATGVTFRDLKVSWDAGSVTANGAYAVYPVKCKNILIENVEVIGAADAGIYVGQSNKAIVKNCKIHGSVAGIESENTNDMEVIHNEVWDNTAGILVFALPNLEKKDALRTDVHDNAVHDNNRDNFAAMGSTVSHVPPGIGILLLAAQQAEVHDNQIANQDTVGAVMVSGKTFAAIGGGAWNDPMTDPYPEGNYVHDNGFTHCGDKPHPPIDTIPVKPLENFLWDGEVDPSATPDEDAAMDAGTEDIDLCLGTKNLPTFRDVNGLANLDNPSKQSTDTKPFACAHTPLSPVSF